MSIICVFLGTNQQSADAITLKVVIDTVVGWRYEELAARILPYKAIICIGHGSDAVLSYIILQKNLTTCMGDTESYIGLIGEVLCPIVTP